MSTPITITVTGEPSAIADLLSRVTVKADETEKVPWWVTETPWFERFGKLTPEQAADLEAGTYGKSFDHAARANAYARYRAKGFMTRDEIRAALNLK